MRVPREVLQLNSRINMVGVTADIPDACVSNNGTMYLATDDDGGTLFRSNGTSWVQVAKGVTESGGSGETNTASNIGSGADIFSAKVGVDLEFRGVLGSEGVQAAVSSDNVEVKADVNALTADGSPDGAADFVMTYDTSAGSHKKVLLDNLSSGGGTNTLLDGSVHTDTLAGTVVRGDVMVGNSTPKWSRLAKGTNREALTSDGTDSAWAPTAPDTVMGQAVAGSHVLLNSTSGTWTDVTFSVGFVTVDIIYAGLVNGSWLTGFSSLAHRLLTACKRTVGSGTIELRLYDKTNSLQIATVAGITSATEVFTASTSFSNIPSGDARVALQYKTSDGTTVGGLYGYSWEVQPA